MVQWKRYHPVQIAVNEREVYREAVISRFGMFGTMRTLFLFPSRKRSNAAVEYRRRRPEPYSRNPGAVFSGNRFAGIIPILPMHISRS
jgi:hypothetical protein